MEYPVDWWPKKGRTFYCAMLPFSVIHTKPLCLLSLNKTPPVLNRWKLFFMQLLPFYKPIKVHIFPFYWPKTMADLIIKLLKAGLFTEISCPTFSLFKYFNTVSSILCLVWILISHIFLLNLYWYDCIVHSRLLRRIKEQITLIWNIVHTLILLGRQDINDRSK